MKSYELYSTATEEVKDRGRLMTEEEAKTANDILRLTDDDHRWIEERERPEDHCTNY